MGCTLAKTAPSNPLHPSSPPRLDLLLLLTNHLQESKKKRIMAAHAVLHRQLRVLKCMKVGLGEQVDVPELSESGAPLDDSKKKRGSLFNMFKKEEPKPKPKPQPAPPPPAAPKPAEGASKDLEAQLARKLSALMGNDAASPEPKKESTPAESPPGPKMASPKRKSLRKTLSADPDPKSETDSSSDDDAEESPEQSDGSPLPKSPEPANTEAEVTQNPLPLCHRLSRFLASGISNRLAPSSPPPPLLPFQCLRLTVGMDSAAQEDLSKRQKKNFDTIQLGGA